MKTVWILFESTDGFEPAVFGVFSSFEKAEAARVKKQMAKRNSDIEKWVIDDEE